MWSAANCNLDIGKLLLDRGADPDKAALLPSRSGIAAAAVAAAARGSSLRLCNACRVYKASTEFSNSQRGKSILRRRCKGCVDAKTPISSGSALKLANAMRHLDIGIFCLTRWGTCERIQLQRRLHSTRALVCVLLFSCKNI